MHGFPERTGGVSQGEHRESLSLGSGRGGDPQHVAENRRRVAEVAGFDPEKLVVTKHVHGIGVWCVGEPLPSPPEFDGLVSDEPGVVLGAFAADCVPLVFGDAEARICGAAHAGWRGTVGGVGARVAERMVGLGANADQIICALGPSIGSCCFEVGDEVVTEFTKAFPDLPGLVVAGPRRNHIDLRVATRYQLEAVGLRAENIDDAPPCTMCHADRFFSYRRDGSGAGTHMGFIAIR